VVKSYPKDGQERDFVAISNIKYQNANFKLQNIPQASPSGAKVKMQN